MKKFECVGYRRVDYTNRNGQRVLGSEFYLKVVEGMDDTVTGYQYEIQFFRDDVIKGDVVIGGYCHYELDVGRTGRAYISGLVFDDQ